MPQKMDPPSTFDLPTRTLAAVVGHAQQSEGELTERNSGVRVEKEKVEGSESKKGLGVEEGKERGTVNEHKQQI